MSISTNDPAWRSRRSRAARLRQASCFGGSPGWSRESWLRRVGCIDRRDCLTVFGREKIMLHLRRTAVALCVGGALAGCGAGHDPPTESLDEAPVVAIERLVAAVPRARVERSSAGSVARV